MSRRGRGRSTTALALVALVAMMVALEASPGPAAAVEPAAQSSSGLAVATDFSLSLINVAAGGDVTRSFGIEGGLFFGYKLDRLILGLGFDILRFSLANASMGVPNAGPDSSATSTAITIAPGVQIALLRSQDQRVELYAALDVGWVHFFTSREPPPQASMGTTSTESLTYRVGPGLRYWIHPSFAFFVAPSLRGLYRWTTTRSDTSGTATESVSLTTVDADIGFLAVF